MRRRALTAPRFRAREARGREFPKGSTSPGPSGGRRESSGLEDRVLDRTQSLISRGTSSISLPSVGLGFPICQPSSSHPVSAESSWSAGSLKEDIWGLGSDLWKRKG